MYLCNTTKYVDAREQGGTLQKAYRTRGGNRIVDICTYCLMPNHFHILIKEMAEGGASKFMQKLTTGYTMYFNKRYKHTGALFQGTYKSSHANTDQYLSYLIAYIHLNPVKIIEPNWKKDGILNLQRAEMYLKEYPHSSYLDYLGKTRVHNCIINKSALPEYCSTPQDFMESVKTWLSPKV
ncbi:MAG: transposase [Candidatus Campbellbacteria bacterium]|nr:transposase [Candidatus Campbellbacteria bacterium]